MSERDRVLPSHMNPAPEALFLPGSDMRGGQRFALYHRPARSEARGTVLFVHPFAEEMNKARRMAALQSRALARAGYAVLQIDLLGCGDSSGDFGDATWEGWIDDVVAASHWMRRRWSAPLTLWGLRGGCLIALEAGQRIASAADFLLWQPPASGKQLLQQFLRLKLAADLQNSAAKGKMESMRTQLAAGKSVEVAGYVLSPALAAGLESATPTAPARTSTVVWLEVSTREHPALLPASTLTIERWRHAGPQVSAQVVQGPAFWQSAEIEEVPALIEATLAAVGQVEPA